MVVPSFEEFMLPILKLAADGKQHTLAEVRQNMIELFNLKEDDINQLLPSGRQTTLINRTAWAKVYLERAQLLKSISRGIFEITDKGRNLLSKNPYKITVKLLMQYPEFKTFHTYQKQVPANSDKTYKEVISDRTPIELMDESIKIIDNELNAKLKEKIQSNLTPEKFEKLTLDLLKAMGYGEPIHLGRPGDEGVDGLINEDSLGLNKIYIQAKRWENGSTVGAKEVQAFSGALSGKKSNNGIFITTSSFSKEAREYVNKTEKSIILIDGDMLTRLMIKYNLGVRSKTVYTIKDIDEDYFTDE